MHYEREAATTTTTTREKQQRHSIRLNKPSKIHYTTQIYLFFFFCTVSASICMRDGLLRVFLFIVDHHCRHSIVIIILVFSCPCPWIDSTRTQAQWPALPVRGPTKSSFDSKPQIFKFQRWRISSVWCGTFIHLKPSSSSASSSASSADAAALTEQPSIIAIIAVARLTAASQSGHTEWMKKQRRRCEQRRRERPSSSVPCHSSALLWESFKLWEWNAVKQYTYARIYIHKATHKHSTRFMPSEQWNETPAYVNCTTENGNAEANGTKYDVVRCNELEPKYKCTRKKKEWHFFVVVVVSLYFSVNCLCKYCWMCLCWLHGREYRADIFRQLNSRFVLPMTIDSIIFNEKRTRIRWGLSELPGRAADRTCLTWGRRWPLPMLSHMHIYCTGRFVLNFFRFRFFQRIRYQCVHRACELGWNGFHRNEIFELIHSRKRWRFVKNKHKPNKLNRFWKKIYIGVSLDQINNSQ